MENIIVDAIIIRNNKVLLARRSKIEDESGKWSFPGGRVDKGELLEHALARELKEELGLDMKSAHFFKEYFIKSKAGTVKALYFMCDVSIGAIRLNDELASYKWFRIDEELLDLDFSFNQKSVTQDLISWFQK